MKTFKKTLLLSVCALILVAATVMGTMAYLTAEDTVTNTFASTALVEKEGDFVLTEHDLVTNELGKYELDTDVEVDKNDYEVLPGVDLPKDPFVRVKVKADAYLFLEVENNLPEGMSFVIDDTQWVPLMDGSAQVSKNGNKIYTRKAGVIAPAQDAETLNILDKKTVTVGEGFDPSALNSDAAAGKTLVFNAYLGQARADDYNTALGAWNTLFAG